MLETLQQTRSRRRVERDLNQIRTVARQVLDLQFNPTLDHDADLFLKGAYALLTMARDCQANALARQFPEKDKGF